LSPAAGAGGARRLVLYEIPEMRAYALLRAYVSLRPEGPLDRATKNAELEIKWCRFTVPSVFAPKFGGRADEALNESSPCSDCSPTAARSAGLASWLRAESASRAATCTRAPASDPQRHESLFTLTSRARPPQLWRKRVAWGVVQPWLRATGQVGDHSRIAAEAPRASPLRRARCLEVEATTQKVRPRRTRSRIFARPMGMPRACFPDCASRGPPDLSVAAGSSTSLDQAAKSAPPHGKDEPRPSDRAYCVPSDGPPSPVSPMPSQRVHRVHFTRSS
jgi:hypothetical protein